MAASHDTPHAHTAVVGDVHLRARELAALLDGPLADTAHVVLLGDLLDRGPDTVDDTLALAARPRVTYLCGNHELAYLGGPVYRGMRDRGSDRAGISRRLRQLVLDGRLRAAAEVDGVLCVHGGLTTALWQRHLRERCGDDPAAIATELNRRFVLGVGRNDFRDPIFAALDADVRGPFWASLATDLLADGLPPFDQAVGHSRVDEVGWHPCGRGGRGRVLATCLDGGPGTAIGWAALERPVRTPR